MAEKAEAKGSNEDAVVRHAKAKGKCQESDEGQG